MKTAMYAIIKKDFRGVASNRRLFSALLIVPLALTIVLPSIFVIAIHFVPDDPDITKLLSLLPEAAQAESLELTLSGMVLNYILPVFFLMIPIMAASIMAASAFVGEKERHTLETLLYCPLTLKQIFQAKVWASFLLSMLVSLISFTAMLLVIEAELFFLMGRLLAPSVSWLVVMLLLSPAISLIAVTLIVRGSAKAQSVEESQQAAVFSNHSAYSAYSRTVYRRPLNECLDSSRTRCCLRNTRLVSFAKIYGTIYLRKTSAIKDVIQQIITIYRPKPYGGFEQIKAADFFTPYRQLHRNYSSTPPGLHLRSVP